MRARTCIKILPDINNKLSSHYVKQKQFRVSSSRCVSHIHQYLSVFTNLHACRTPYMIVSESTIKPLHPRIVRGCRDREVLIDVEVRR